MPIKKIKQINLIPQNEFDSTPLGRILKWALSTFRVMVIVTELIVMSAFLSRFWLDAKNSDLNEEMGVYKSQVLAYSEIEAAIRLNQKKLDIAKTLYGQAKIDETINTISKLIPPDVSLNSISIEGSKLSIKATAFSEKSVLQFIVNLGADKNFKDVNLNQIATDAENTSLTIFSLTAVIK